jgi:hypothetical protein
MRIFCSNTGTYLGRSNLIRHVYHPTLAQAGLSKIRFHDLCQTARCSSPGASIVVGSGRGRDFAATPQFHGRTSTLQIRKKPRKKVFKKQFYRPDVNCGIDSSVGLVRTIAPAATGNRWRQGDSSVPIRICRSGLLPVADNTSGMRTRLGVHVLQPSACFSALHTFQAFGNSEEPPRNNGLRGALAVE